MKNYHVFLDNKIAGHAEIRQEGLYFRVVAHCVDIPPDFYRLFACTGHNNIDLGLCIHRKGMYMWNKKIPVKGINVEEIRFVLQSSDRDQDLFFICIEPTEQFRYFSSISSCVYKEKDGQKGVCIMKHHPDMQD